MKIDWNDIDPQLKSRGYILDKMLGSGKKGFKITNWLLRMSKGKNIPGYKCSEEYIQSRNPGEKIRIRIFRPNNSRSDIPGILYLHGGGYAMGLPESELGVIKRFLEKRECVIVAPDYTTSLQASYPAAINDCYDTLGWMIKNSGEIGFKSNQIFTIGPSAGGGLVIALNLLARDIGDLKVAFQMPLYPMIDDTMSTASMKDNNSPVWNEQRSRVAWSLYIKEEEVPYYAAPYRCTDFSRMPPSCTFVGSLDPFIDETRYFVEKMKQAKIKCDLKVYDGAYHAFEIAVPTADKSKDAVEFIMNEFSYAVDNIFSDSN